MRKSRVFELINKALKTIFLAGNDNSIFDNPDSADPTAYTGGSPRTAQHTVIPITQTDQTNSAVTLSAKQIALVEFLGNMMVASFAYALFSQYDPKHVSIAKSDLKTAIGDIAVGAFSLTLSLFVAAVLTGFEAIGRKLLRLPKETTEVHALFFGKHTKAYAAIVSTLTLGLLVSNDLVEFMGQDEETRHRNFFLFLVAGVFTSILPELTQFIKAKYDGSFDSLNETVDVNGADAPLMESDNPTKHTVRLTTRQSIFYVCASHLFVGNVLLAHQFMLAFPGVGNALAKSVNPAFHSATPAVLPLINIPLPLFLASIELIVKHALGSQQKTSAAYTPFGVFTATRALGTAMLFLLSQITIGLCANNTDQYTVLNNDPALLLLMQIAATMGVSRVVDAYSLANKRGIFDKNDQGKNTRTFYPTNTPNVSMRLTEKLLPGESSPRDENSPTFNQR